LEIGEELWTSLLPDGIAPLLHDLELINLMYFVGNGRLWSDFASRTATLLHQVRRIRLLYVVYGSRHRRAWNIRCRAS
jgi:hypothetical protein